MTAAVTAPGAPVDTLGERPRRTRTVTTVRSRLSTVTAVMVDASRPMVRRLGRVLGVVTPLGWGVILTTVATGVAGQTLGWWELTTLALCGAVLLAICALFLIGRTEYDVSLDLTRQRIVAGERANGSLELRNPGRRPQLPTRVVLTVGAGHASFDIPRLLPDEAHDEVFAIPTTRRAVLPVGPVSAVRGDPLGLFQRMHAWSTPVELFVHPRTVRIEGTSAGLVRDLEGLPTRDLSPDDVSFHALREYAAGDDLRHVHWRSTARTGTVMVRQFEDTRRSQIVVALSRAAYEYADADEFELAVSTAGSLGLQSLREGHSTAVVCQNVGITTRSGRPFLDALTRLDTASRVADITHLSARAAAAGNRASAVVFVTGSATSALQLRDAARHLPANATAVGVVCHSGAVPSIRRLGSATILTVGTLSDVPGGIRRALS